MKKKILTSSTKVRFQDCDPFNHLNNSKYIDYFVNAREDQLIKYYNLDIFEVAKKRQKAWVVADHRIAYLKPAFTHEDIIIESQLIKFSKKSLIVEMKMYNADLCQLKSVLWTTYVHVDMITQKPMAHDNEFLQLFSEVESPIDQSDFNERIQVIRGAA